MPWTRIGPVLACLLVVACAGCKVERIVWLVGDSTAQGDLLPALHFEATVRHHDLVIPVAALGGAALGRDLSAFVKRLRSAGARGVPADVVVVSLGSNDLGDIPGVPPTYVYMDTSEERAAALDAFLSALPAVPVLWIMPHAPVHDPEPFAEREVGFRASLVDAQARWPELTLLDAAPEWYEGSDADRVHFTREGEVLAANAILGALADNGQ